MDERRGGRMTKQEDLDVIAQRAIAIGAPGYVFERLHRLGWKSPSALQGSGIPACGPSCEVCHPVYRANRRRKGV
jgi:hypothetical protein